MFRRNFPRFLIGLLFAAAAALILYIGIVTFGRVSGEEFAPDSFERRHYYYYELPLVRLKISPIRRTVSQNQLETALVNGKYLTPNTPPTRWDFVSARRAAVEWCHGDALILCRYLDAWDPANNFVSFWETWTTNHPALAKVLWPPVADLARRNRYYLIPPLFDRALASDDAQELQTDLNGLMAECLEQTARTEWELEHFDEALELYQAALGYQPDRAACREGRAACLKALGRAESTSPSKPDETPQLEADP